MFCGMRGEILGMPQDEPLQKHLQRMFSLIRNESQRFKDDQILSYPSRQPLGNQSLGPRGSMGTKLKLKGIDGRAPLGVEPAA